MIGPSGVDTFYTRCKACYWPAGDDLHETEQALPSIPARRLIYLDHHFYVRVADGDARYVALHDRLSSLVRLQAIACPISDLHGEENVLAEQREQREDIARRLSAGVMLHASHTIQHGQAVVAAKAMLAGAAPTYETGPGNGLSQGTLTGWYSGGAFAFLQPLPGLLDEIRSNKRLSKEHLAAVAKRWQGEDPATAFKGERARELQAQGATWLAQLDRHYTRFLQTMFEKGGSAAMQVGYDDAPFAVYLQTQLDRLFQQDPESGTSKSVVELIHPRTRDFLTGDAIQTIPYSVIKSALWAGLARRYAADMTKAPDQGMATDVEYMSSFLPYVDAMYVDKRCWQLATSNPVRDSIAEAGHVGQLFSTLNFEEFEAYLDEIEATVDDERRGFVDLIYGVRS